VSNVFIGKNEEVVSTRGKVAERDQVYRTRNEPVDAKIPLVVLIDGKSASASEIVSGVMQDLDRGILIGQLSYGKGLVQNTREVGYNARLKMTTSKYYIPSGRCIQSVKYANGAPVNISDDQRTQFKTRNGRIVLDGGGVRPDVVVPKPEVPELVKMLNKQHLVFKYVTEYCRKHETIPDIEVFRFTGFDDFTAFLQKSGFRFESSAEETIKSLEQQMTALEMPEKLIIEARQLRKQVSSETQTHLEKHKTSIVTQIEMDIAGRYFFEKGKTLQRMKDDPELQKAIEILNHQEQYKALLKP
jgi:carboxyl-terminal processing protease